MLHGRVSQSEDELNLRQKVPHFRLIYQTVLHARQHHGYNLLINIMLKRTLVTTLRSAQNVNVALKSTLFK